MNMNEPLLPPAPKSGRAAQRELRAGLLEEITKHNRTTHQLATILEVEQTSIAYPLRVMEAEGLITSFTDRRNMPRNALSRVWVINIEKKAVEPKREHDTWLWALFGARP